MAFFASFHRTFGKSLYSIIILCFQYLFLLTPACLHYRFVSSLLVNLSDMSTHYRNSLMRPLDFPQRPTPAALTFVYDLCQYPSTSKKAMVVQ